MHPLWTTRLIDAPVENYLTAEQVGRLFGFGAETVERLVKAGEFPEPIQTSPGTKMWDWKACAYYQMRVELKNRLKLKPDLPAEK